MLAERSLPADGGDEGRFACFQLIERHGFSVDAAKVGLSAGNVNPKK
jgi:hypothetical protein